MNTDARLWLAGKYPSPSLVTWEKTQPLSPAACLGLDSCRIHLPCVGPSRARSNVLDGPFEDAHGRGYNSSKEV